MVPTQSNLTRNGWIHFRRLQRQETPTKVFLRHGGRMQKELEMKKKESEMAAAQAAKATTEEKKKV
jgi:hypothetical protein